MESADNSSLELDELDQPSFHQATPPLTLHAPVSPPPTRNRRRNRTPPLPESEINSISTESHPPNNKPNVSTSAVEAGLHSIPSDAQLEYWSSHLSPYVRRDALPPLSTQTFADLYSANAGKDRGAHFVIHQHDHPVAGLHYDLRLQINRTSSASWAIMKGLPGNWKGRKITRNATETRVHAVWNHLIETASLNTGSMLIWDTGTYEVQPYHSSHSHAVITEDEHSSTSSSSENIFTGTNKLATEQEKLGHAFKNRKIRLRLHGSRLPSGYTVTLRLSSKDDIPHAPSIVGQKNRGRKRKRSQPHTESLRTPSPPSSPERTDELENAGALFRTESNREASFVDVEMDQGEDEQVAIRRDNAYPGALNDVVSVHQRRWYLTLDRVGSGFVRKGNGWLRKGTMGFEPFFVMGREEERSVITGRLAGEVLSDESVEGFVPRKGWMAVMD